MSGRYTRPRRVPLPTPVKRVLRRWLRQLRSGSRSQAHGRNVANTSQGRRSRRSRSLALLAQVDQVLPATPRPRLNVVVGVAASERVRAGLAWEWNQLLLTSNDWKHVLADPATTLPDLVLLEFTQGGVPGWRQVENDPVEELVTWCQGNGVPAVLWVTSDEDPELAASLVGSVDRIFVHDPATAERWRARFPTQPVDVLLPATQPRLHHPSGPTAPADHTAISTGEQASRNLAAVLVVDPAGIGRTAGDALDDMVERGLARLPMAELDVWATANEPAEPASTPNGNERAEALRHELPHDLRRRMVGTRPYEKLAALLPRYRVLVDAGRTDPAAFWSLLDAGAAQTSVVVPESLGRHLPPDLADSVAVVDDPARLRGEVVARIHQDELRDRTGLRLHRAVLARYTYAHRTEQILASLGRTTPPRHQTVSAIVPTNRKREIPNVLANIARQRHRDLELVLVLHGIDVSSREIRAQARDLGIEHLTIIDADKTQTLGACMNLGIEAASGAYIAKMDDDNYYGAHYLTDLVAAFDYTEADVVGKWAHYVWLRSSNAVILRYAASENRYARRVQGGSMVIRSDLARELKFADLPRAVDTDYLDRALAAGVRIYSTDRFNFVSIRSPDRTAHTWQVDDVTFMTVSGRLVFYGDPRTHVDV